MIVKQDNQCVFLLSIVNITEERTQKIGEVLYKSVSDIMLLFDDVHVLNPEQDTADTVLNNFGCRRIASCLCICSGAVLFCSL